MHLYPEDVRAAFSMVLFSEEPIRAIQQFSTPWLDVAFVLITELGSRWILFILAMLGYYLIDKRAAFFVMVALFTSNVANGLLKDFFGLPRPSVELHKAGSSGNGFPSGHAQSSAAFWSGTALRLRGFWIPLGALVIALVSFSRVYLGVHFIGDVLGGVAFGIIVVAIATLASRAGVWARLDVRSKILLGLLVPTIAQGVLFVVAGRVFTVLGLLSGICVGYVLEGKWIRLERPSTAAVFLIRLLVGGALLTGLEFTRDRIEYAPAAYGFVFLVGLIATVAIPWLFLRIEARIPRRHAERSGV